MRDRPFCIMFPHHYHLSSLKFCVVAEILVWLGSFFFFSFGFLHPVSDRKMREVITLQSLMGEIIFRMGDGMRVLRALTHVI